MALRLPDPILKHTEKGKRQLRIVLMGTGPFAVPSFDAIHASGEHEILLVVTRPIKNVEDGKNKPLANPVRAWAESCGLPVIDPASINDPASIVAISQLQSDLLVVCDYGQILSSEALAAARLGGVNLHGSLLPRHRGAAPVQWSILRGDSITGDTVIHMTPKLDGGPILSQVTTPIGENETAGELEKRLSELGVQCCIDAIAKLSKISRLEDAEALGKRQDQSLATPAPRLAKTDGQLDFDFPAYLIDRQIRGLSPWPGTFGTIQIANGKELRVIVGRARLTRIPIASSANDNHSVEKFAASSKFTPGTILWGNNLRTFLSQQSTADFANRSNIPQMAVACCDEFLEIEQIQPSGKKMQLAKEFLAGYGKAETMRFVTSTSESSRKLLDKMQQ